MPDSPSDEVLLQRRAFALAGEAYEVPDADRAAFLDGACAGDADLRAAVEALLAFDEEAHSLLDVGVQRLFEDAPAPESVGGYRVVGELGRGGMGVVYAAERADGVYDRTVALKVVQAGRATGESVRRFERERRVLSRLDHPGIARLLDGGVTDGGRPYFVMERVDGQPLTAYARSRGLGLVDRLRLALDVCDAVAHAHRLLVVHRDLKPSNVFVGDDDVGRPQVKLLDFGIAKALDDDDADDLLTRTGTALTPAYAAPEQVSGDPVTAATDVYALGVLFYELLVGRRPYTFRTNAPAEVARVVRESEPTRPSEAVATETAAPGAAPAAPEGAASWAAPPRHLRGDLDAILLKALRKEPERRYATAGELADDLRRHLEGRPVEARGDTVGYRTSRFVRRHRVGVAAAATLAVALVAGVAAVLWQARETAREAARANATLDVILGTFEAIDPVELEGGRIGPRDLIAPGLRQAATLDGQPLVQASLLEGIGRLGISLGLFSTADSVLGRAVEIRRREQGAEHPDLAGPLVLLVEARTAEQRYAEAIAAGQEAIRVLGSARPDALVDAQIALAQAHYRTYETDASKALYRAALATAREPGPRVAALSGLATQLEESDSLDAALPLFEQSTDLARRAFGSTDPRTADALYGQAEAVRSLDIDRARRLHEEALAVYERAFGRGDYRTGLSLYSLAVLHHGDAPDDAERYYRSALAAYEGSTLDEDHVWREYARVGLGGLLLETGRPAEALPLLKSGADAFAEEWGPADPRALSPRAQYGAALFDTGRTADGIAVLRAVEATLAQSDPESPFHLAILRKLAAVLTEAGRASEARAVARTSEALQASAR